MVDVAQLVEHRIVVPTVVGSKPIIHPTKGPSSKGKIPGFDPGDPGSNPRGPAKQKTALKKSY